MDMQFGTTGVYIALVGFLFLNFTVGIYQSKHIKNLRDYALANRSFGTFSVMMTLGATVIGAKYLTVKITDAQEIGLIVPLFQAIGFMGWYCFWVGMCFRVCLVIRIAIRLGM